MRLACALKGHRTSCAYIPNTISELINRFQICPTIVLSHDNYYKDKIDVDRDCGGNWDCPEALHTAELVRDLEALKGR